MTPGNEQPGKAWPGSCAPCRSTCCHAQNKVSKISNRGIINVASSKNID